jgi:YVTN family beta-propeller protein
MKIILLKNTHRELRGRKALQSFPFKHTSMNRTTAIITCVIISSVVILFGCQTLPLQTLQPLGDEGEVFVYVQPFPQEAVNLRFSINALSAVRDDGREFPLELSVHEFTGTEMSLQRLVASGRLPEGRYTGFLLGTQRASVTTEAQGTSDLLVPETPQKEDFRFSVEKKTAMVIALTLQHAESLHAGTFTPRFRVTVSPRPLAELTGYVSNTGDDTVILFDKIKMQATGAIATGRGPRGIVLDPQTKKAYVALSGDDVVEVIDMREGTLFDRILLQRGDNPVALALTPDGRSLLVVNEGAETVSIIDTLSRVERTRILVGRSPCSLTIDPSGRRAFVVNRQSNSLSVIDIPYQTVASTIATGPEPLRVQFNRSGDRLYVTHARYPYLYVLDSLSLSLLQQQFIGAGIAFLKVDTWTDLLYIVKSGETVITLYNPVTFAPVGYISTRGTATYMTIDGETNNLYAVVPERRSLVVISLMSKKTVAEIDVSRHPSWVALLGER